MTKTGPWYAKRTCVTGWSGGIAALVKGGEYWDPRLPAERPELFVTSKAEAMRPDPQTRACRHCGAVFEVPTGPASEQVYCGRKCRKAREVMLRRAGRIVGRPIDSYPSNSLDALERWMARHAENRAVVEHLRGHLTEYTVGLTRYENDDLNLRNEVEQRGLLIAKVNEWSAKAEQIAHEAESLTNTLRSTEEQRRLMHGYAQKAREREGFRERLQQSWDRFFSEDGGEGPKRQAVTPSGEPGPVGDFVYPDDPGVY